MTSSGDAIISALYRYPVKGLGPQKLGQSILAAGEPMPFDRAWAIENGRGRFDPAKPRHLPKINFLMLMRNERLAALDIEFDESGSTLTLFRNGRQVVKGALDEPIGRRLIEQFMASYMQDDLRGAPHIVHAPGHSFCDVAAKCLHIVNLASVRALERSLGKPVDPLRFRANIYIEAEPPWVEFDWIDREIGAGEARLNVFARTGRCAATNVDPRTGARDLAIPAALTRRYGHQDFGIYASVVRGGKIAPGDRVGGDIQVTASSGVSSGSLLSGASSGLAALVSFAAPSAPLPLSAERFPMAYGSVTVMVTTGGRGKTAQVPAPV